MGYRATLRGERFHFADLRELLAKANEPKSGDELAGIAAGSLRERVAAKLALAEVTLGELAERPVVEDELEASLLAAHDREAFAAIASSSVGELRDALLDPSSRAELALRRAAILPSMAAAVANTTSGTSSQVGARRKNGWEAADGSAISRAPWPK